MYDPLRAAVRGDLTGTGTLGTVLLCETLLSYLPTGNPLNQPYRILTAYDVEPRSALRRTNRIYLRPYATTKNGVLYIRCPAIEKLWVPLTSIPGRARSAAAQALDFLKLLKGRCSRGASYRSAEIIVNAFRRDLFEMGVVTDMGRLDGDIQDGSVVDTTTFEEYVHRVFKPDSLPAEMSSKNFMFMAMDLLDEEQLRSNLAAELMRKVKMVPKTTIHARKITFSRSQYTLLLSGALPLGLSSDDVHRLVVAAAPLIKDNFPTINKKETKLMLKKRPCLIRSVKGAVHTIRRRHGTRTSIKHLLAVACFAAVILAQEEKLFHRGRRVDFKRLYRATNMSRDIRLKDLRKIVRRAVAGEAYGLPEVQVVLDKVVTQS